MEQTTTNGKIFLKRIKKGSTITEYIRVQNIGNVKLNYGC